ncbi:hypothetical protein BXZ70DRAFT_1003132 [Cristinia sonorae]|uniref:F-box domain-containing protein n=1 Tax=Cristinia sonorae TaxID=1940300 RepID=A0A8K0XUH7_9AGAR|nr:hypothetical protein BXZ70DRAFT_1003132 [Cristinia sonorae]
MVVQQLPNELLEQILIYSDLQTIARFRRVSKRFNQVVAASITVQYKLELEIDCLEDAPSQAMAVGDRLLTLEKYRASWTRRSLPFTKKRVLLRNIDHINASCSGEYCAFLNAQRHLEVHRKSPAGTQTPEGALWSITDLRIPTGIERIHAFWIDHKENLLAILVWRDNDGCIVYLRDWVSGDDHPQANFPILRLSRPGAIPNGAHSEKELLYVRLVRPLRKTTCMIFNWKSGDRLLSISSATCMSLYQLSTRYLLIAHDTRTAPFTLSIIDFDATKTNKDRTVNILRVKKVCQLTFPEKRGNFCASITNIIDWRPQRTLQEQSIPFSPRDGIIIISAEYTDVGRISEYPTCLVSCSTLLNLIELARENGRDVLAWEEWGPPNTRLWNMVVGFTGHLGFFGMRGFVFHNRVDQLQGWSQTFLDISLYDFGKIGVRKHREDMAAGLADPRVYMSESSRYGGIVIFKDRNLTTRLPARVMYLTLPI